ncbi:MAG TPA: SpoVG family protein [Oscillospiraceae bacterium]|nr:SpoVG family protein [Oscillospiraceae bacterium]
MSKNANVKEAAPKYDVKIHSIHPEGTLRATASVNIYGDFAVRGVKVMEGSKGLFISMPSYKAGNGEYRDICFPCTKEAKAEFDSAVISAYQQTLAQGQSSAKHQDAAAPSQEPGQSMAGM